jgi:uncharacterized protein (TIGR04255 family)
MKDMKSSDTRGSPKGFPILRKSPIVEATFQMNFVLKSPLTDSTARAFVQSHFPDFKYKETIYSESIEFKKKTVREPPETITHHQNWVGVRFVRDNRVITILSSGFAFGILKPYPSDESFFGEISAISKMFREQYADIPVTRLGLRFINRFAVDAPEHKPDRLFVTVPSLTRELGYGDPLKFLYQDVFQDRETGVVVVSNRLYPANGQDTPHEQKALLDIDASMTPNQVLDEGDFANAVSCLRLVVNKTFFGSVQESIISELS